MTEEEWLACNDPKPMLEYLHGKASDRKLRLFACACGRALSHLLSDKPYRNAIEIAERYADRQASESQLASKRAEANHFAANGGGRYDGPLWYASWFSSPYAGAMDSREHPYAPVMVALASVLETGSEAAELAAPWATALGASPRLQAAFLRDIVHPPYRPVFSEAAWRLWNNGTVSKLAKAIYDDRAFDHLPLLANALMDAGCTNEDILGHCRTGGEHVRGCWVVDLVLGKG